MKRYGEMSQEELEEEAKRLWQDLQTFQQEERDSDAAIAERKYYMARSYLTDPNTIQPSKVYTVEGEEGLFKVDYLNGVMAWGSFEGSSEKVSFAIAMLQNAGE